MRALTEDETRLVFEKLHKFIGKNIKALVDGSMDDQNCLRLQKGRVYFVREDIMKRATNVARDKLVSLGTCIGKFTHSGKFRLTIGCLDVMARYAKYKVCVLFMEMTRENTGWLDDVNTFISVFNPNIIMWIYNVISNTWTESLF